MNRGETTAMSDQAPTLSFDEACKRAERFDEGEPYPLQPTAHTRLFTHGRRTERSAVLFHGITNHPLQWEAFGQSLHADGWNVLIPRLPYHGLVDLMTTLPGKLTRRQMIEYAAGAVSVAEGLGEQVSVVGLSAGGVYSAWAAQNRTVARAIVIAPLFGLHGVPLWATPVVTGLFLRLPNQMRWWNARIKRGHIPPHAYPRFSTRNLAETLTLGEEVARQAQKLPPLCRDIRVVSNTADRAISNGATDAVATIWKKQGADVRSYLFAESEGLPHDVIDLTQPRGKTRLVYGVLREMLG